MEKAWLSEQGVDFEARNVVEDPVAMQELEQLGYYSTPVTLVDDEAVVGFDKEKLKDLLKLE